MTIRNIIITTLLSLFLMSCSTASVLNIKNEPFSMSSSKTSLTQVTEGIVAAGNKLGWKMNRVKLGYIVATLHLRTHMAKVNINYSNKKYSITYKDSKHLKYDGESIHRHYNGWVQNLSNAIQTQVYNSSQL